MNTSYRYRRELGYSAVETLPEAPTERKMVLGTSRALGNFLTFGANGAVTPSGAMALYDQSTAVSIPINLITEAFSVLDPIVLLDGEIVRQHPVLDLLADPNPSMDQVLFLDVLSKNYLIAGESPMVALGSLRSAPQELMPLSPKSVTAVQGGSLTTAAGQFSSGIGDAPTRWTVSGNTLVGTYEATAIRGDVVYLDGNLRELQVLRAYSTRNNSLLRGQSKLVSAAREARQSILGVDHNVSLLEKGGRVSLVFHFEEDMSDDEFEAVKNRVRSQYGGAERAGEIGVTSGDGKLDIKTVGVSNRDMDYANLQVEARKAVALQYQVPIPLISDQRQTLNNYGIAKLALYDDAVIPLSKRVFGFLTNFLMPRFGLDPSRNRITFDPDTVPALVERRNTELVKRRQIGIESDNELREFIGRPGYVGGELHLKPANLVPAGVNPFGVDPTGGDGSGTVPANTPGGQESDEADEDE